MSVIKNISASPKEDKNSESPRSLEGEMDSISAESLTGKLKVRFMDIEEWNRWEIGNVSGGSKETLDNALKSLLIWDDGIWSRKEKGTLIPWNKIDLKETSAVYQLCNDKDPISFNRKASLLAEALVSYGKIKNPEEFLTLSLEDFQKYEDPIKYDIAYRLVMMKPLTDDENDYLINKNIPEGYIHAWQQGAVAWDSFRAEETKSMVEYQTQIVTMLWELNKDQINGVFENLMKGKKPSPQRSTFAVGDYSTTRSYDGVDKSLKNERNTRFFLYNSNNLRENSAKIDLHQDQDSEVMLQFSGLDHRIEAANINFTITFLDPTNLETKITGTYGSRGINFDNSALLDNKNIGYVQGWSFCLLTFPKWAVKANEPIKVSMTTNYNEIKHTYDEISLNIIAPEVKMQETIELPSLADITLKGSVSSETFFGPGKYELLPEQKEKLQWIFTEINTYAESDEYKQINPITLSACVSNEFFNAESGSPAITNAITTIEKYIQEHEGKLHGKAALTLFEQGKTKLQENRNAFTEIFGTWGQDQVKYQQQLCLARLLTMLLEINISPKLTIEVSDMYVSSKTEKDKKVEALWEQIFIRRTKSNTLDQAHWK